MWCERDECECPCADCERRRLRAACQLVLDFHSADTEAFVARYGAGMTTRQLCDRIRAALRADGSALTPHWRWLAARAVDPPADETREFYRCVWCRRVTYHPSDIEHRYCPCCGSADGQLFKACEHRVA